jgi:hypothetical protein
MSRSKAKPKKTPKPKEEKKEPAPKPEPLKAEDLPYEVLMQNTIDSLVDQVEKGKNTLNQLVGQLRMAEQSLLEYQLRKDKEKK